MSTFQYCHAGDNIAAEAVVETSADDSAYPPAWFVDGFADQPGKLTTTSGWIRFSFSTAVTLAHVMLVHPNFDYPLDVQLQADNNVMNVISTPTFTHPFTLYPRHTDLFPLNPRIPLKEYYPEAADRTFRYWAINIVGINSAPISIGEIRLDRELRDLGIRNIKWGSTRVFRRPAAVHETDRLVRHVYGYGTTVRALEASIDPIDTTMDEVEEWWREAGAERPFTLIPHKDQPDGWMAMFANPDQPYERTKRNYNTMKFQFIETSRGLYP